MGLRPVRGYRGSRYPTLTEYLRKGSGRWTGPALTAAVVLAALAALAGGCSPNGSIS